MKLFSTNEVLCNEVLRNEVAFGKWFYLPFFIIYAIMFPVMKMKKVILGIFGTLLALVLVVAIVLVGNTFMFYSYYKENNSSMSTVQELYLQNLQYPEYWERDSLQVRSWKI